MNNNQLWDSALGEIELNLSKANFTTWFKNTFISSFENDKVVVCVPNTFTKAWLEKKYHSEISKALENILETKIKEILYKVEIRKPQAVDGITKKGVNGKGNELAYAACKAVAANPGAAYNPLFIYGGVGLGKTHLLQAIGHEISKKTDKIAYITSEKFTNEYIQSVKGGQAKEFKEKYRNIDLLMIDDIQFMAGKDGTQEEFFHTFNELHQTNKQIVITSDRAPKSIPALEKRLLSRFEWGMIADVSHPDLETRVAILETKCREKNYLLDTEILNYIASNIQNNIRELEGALNRTIAFHEFNNSIPTIDSTKSVLSSVLSNIQAKSITSKDIIGAVSRYFDVDIKEILGKGRKKELVTPRQLIMFLMRKEINSSFPSIGYEIGGRDHTTAMHACSKITRELEENEKIKQDLESIKQLIYNSNPLE